MPARAVVFNSFRKHDGREFRELLAGEYIQMAGRAGRRGLDKFGTVIITCWNDLPAEVTMRKLLTGRPTLLSSQFRLRYNMILNLVRVNNLSVQEMIKRSYTEFATQRQLSQSEIGSKLRKYEMLLSFYEQEILLTDFEKKRRQQQNNDDSVLDDSEKEKRENYLELVKEYQNSFQAIQGLFFEQLKYLKYQFNSQVSLNKRFDFVGFFSFGRIVQLQNSSSGSPCWGFVLMDPIASKKAATAAKSTGVSVTSKAAGALSLNANSKLTVGKQNTATSAFAASRAALLGQGSASNSVSAAETTNNSRGGGGERGAWGNEGPQDNLEEMFVWTLCLANEKDLPEWCSSSSSSAVVENKKIKRMEETDDKLVLSSLHEEFFCPNHPLSPFMIIKVFLKDIGNTLSPRLSLPSLPSSTTTKEEKETTEQSVSLTELLSEFVLAINPTSSSSSTSSGVVYTDFLKEHKINDINFHERQMKLMNCITQELIPATTLVHSFEEERGNPNPTTNPSSGSLLATADQWKDSFFQLSRLYPKLLKLQKIQRKIDLIKHFISDENLSLFPDFQQRINFLRSLGYLDREENVITKKGRVCCELNTCDELLGTEMLFHNILEPLNPPEAVAILSALIFQEKNDVEEVLTTRMETARSEIVNLLYQINTLQKLEGIEEFSLEDQKNNNQNRKRGDSRAGSGGSGGGSGSGNNSNNQFISSTSNKPIINFGLCSVVYQWARGIPFKEITRMTEFQEGSIVRTITRLDELCRDIQNAARVMGNPSLYYKMEAASQCIKRDIVFAASLYLVD
jgi:hypothetical protein